MSEPDPDLAIPEPQLDFPVVGIGASAGGLKALLEFFADVDASMQAAYVVVVHLSPEHESRVPQLLQAVTSIPVSAVTQRTAIQPNHIYVISPKTDLSMEDGHLDPRPLQARVNGANFTIDRFFDTLADAHHNRAFGIVLSGTGTDGTLGIKSLRTRGGVTFAQAPEDAEYPGMPRSAAASGVDFVLPAGEMPRRLKSIWNNARNIELPKLEDRPSPEDLAALAEDALRDVMSIVRARTGHDFSQYKRSTLLRRLERRMQIVQVKDLPRYRDHLRVNPGEATALLHDLLISVTSFFRDPAAFETLERKVIPQLFEGKEHGGKIRAWSVGCATGEEAYSIAMLLVDEAQRRSTPVEITVFATDIDEDALGFARAALYPESIREQVPADRLHRHFTKEPDGYRVGKGLRERLMFATHNVIQDPPFSKVDLIVCRNLLIYLNRHVQAKVLDLLHFSVRSEGYLFLGSSESVDDQHDGFIVLDKAARLYQQQPRARMGLLVSSLPSIAPLRTPTEIGAVSRRLVSYGELHQSLLEHYAPPSIVVDDRHEVVHVSENAGRFLRISGGEPSLNVFRVVPEELRFEIRVALDAALKSMRSVERVDLPLYRGPQLSHVTVKVHPVRERTTTRTFALIIFEETGDVAPAVTTPPPIEHEVAGQLEERLHDTQAQLRAAVEQYEVQNEELKASNEELQATNEELRATSEELETGKEELQSINEELTTVNQELKNKVDETTRISDDLQNFVHATEIAALFVDRNLHLMRFTPFAREVFNVIPSDVGRPLLDITHRLQDVPLEDDIRSVLDTLRPVEREVRAEGGRWYFERILPYRTKEDRIGGAVLTYVDISHRKDLQDVGRRNRSWLEVVVDSVADYAIMSLTPTGGIESWNRGAECIFGYEASEVVGNSFEVLFVPEDREGNVPADELRLARDAGRAEDDRWQLRKDGSRFYASGICAPLDDPDSHGYVKILRDLTEQKVAQQRREELLEMERVHRMNAEDANRAKDEFLATLSHELRNPLALIQMQSELLLRAPELRQNQRLSSATEVIHQMVRTQAQFVDDMLDVSRLRTGKLALERQLLPLPLIIADSIGALRDEAEDSNITLDVQVTQDPLIVEADAMRVKQIAWNLVSNAIKFTSRGGRVRVSLRREDDQARLDVEDTGQGIAEELLPHVFEWFRQGESGPRRRKGGLGIGLALVKQLVELHGGRVEAASPGVGQGARFTVWLPLQTGTGSSRSLPAPLPPIADIGQRLAGARVLIVDDAPGNADALRELLELEGAQARIAISAHNALAYAKDEQFDVIISDLAMPEMDGHTLVRKVHETPLNAATPAIAYSGYGSPEEIERSRDAGFALHVTKPVDLDRLIEAIDGLRRSREGA